jgi:transmembrane 9 superfamily protein 2/4
MLLAPLLAAVLATAPAARAFYVPGITPHGFDAAERVPLFVNKVSSDRTQLPLEWYDLPVCPLTTSEKETRQHYFENLGEILRGDRVRSSDYKVRLGNVAWH